MEKSKQRRFLEFMEIQVLSVIVVVVDVAILRGETNQVLKF